MKAMSDAPLRRLRDRWVEAADNIEAAETESLRQLTVKQSYRLFCALYDSACYLLTEDRNRFLRSDHEAYLVELQRRLRKLGEWQVRHAQSQPVSRYGAPAEPSG